jgi:hypothetical protein
MARFGTQRTPDPEYVLLISGHATEYRYIHMLVR